MFNAICQYFEEGCLCIITGRIEKQLIANSDAAQYYLENCTCSRHPESFDRFCWDREIDS